MMRFSRLLVAAMTLATSGVTLSAEAPSIRILEPDRNELLEGRTVLRAVVLAPAGVGIVSVSFRIDGRLLGEDSEPPFEALWDPVDAVRDHLIRATAEYSDGTRAYNLHSIPVLGLVTRATVLGDAPDLVRLAVTFLNKDGEPLTDIRREEVQIWEDGRKQAIEHFAPDDRPLSVQLLLDSSDSTQDYWSDLSRSSRLFAETLRPGDRAGVEAFSHRIFPLAPLGSSATEIESATSDFADWGGSTWLYDALSRTALITLGQETVGRKALVVLTDADDRGSTLSVGNTTEFMNHADIQVHSVVWSPEIRFGKGARTKYSIFGRAQRILENLVRSTGGVQVDFTDYPLEETFLRIGEKLRAQYLITYTSFSRKPAGQTREVEVRLKRRGNQKVHYQRTHSGGESLGEYLAQRITHGDDESRFLAIGAASLFQDEDVIQALLQTVLEGDDPLATLPREARLALLHLGPVAVPRLAEAMNSLPDPDKQRSARILADLFVVLHRTGRAELLEEGLLILGRGDHSAGRQALEDLLQEDLIRETRQGLELLLAELIERAP